MKPLRFFHECARRYGESNILKATRPPSLKLLQMSNFRTITLKPPNPLPTRLGVRRGGREEEKEEEDEEEEEEDGWMDEVLLAGRHAKPSGVGFCQQGRKGKTLFPGKLDFFPANWTVSRRSVSETFKAFEKLYRVPSDDGPWNLRRGRLRAS